MSRETRITTAFGVELPSCGGIYVLTHKRTGHQYVGGTVNVLKRIRGHLCLAKSPRHWVYGAKVTRMLRRYGEGAFTATLLEVVNDDTRIWERETYWYERLKPRMNSRPIERMPFRRLMGMRQSHLRRREITGAPTS